MKRKLSCILILAVLFALSACSGSDDPNDSQTTSQTTDRISGTSDEGESSTMSYDDFFDSECLHKPTNEQVSAISPGTKFCDVVEAIGKPHTALDLSLLYQEIIWYTQEGYTCYIGIDIQYDSNFQWPELCMRYGVVKGVTLKPPAD